MLSRVTTHTHYWIDSPWTKTTFRDGYRYELRYIRDKEGREVDFAIVKKGELEELIEAKFSDDNMSKSLLCYAKRLNPKRATQIVATVKRPYDKNQIKVTDPVSYFQKFF